MNDDIQGSCLCERVRFSVRNNTRATACHCAQCRKQSGHYWASGHVERDNVTITGEVKWYQSSEIAQRGFCPECGSTLFWQRHDETAMSFSLGAIDGPTGVRLQRHIFTADKSDYYDIDAGVEQS